MAATEQLHCCGRAGDLPGALIGEAEDAALAERARPRSHGRAGRSPAAPRRSRRWPRRRPGCWRPAPTAAPSSPTRVYFRLGERLALARLATAAQKRRARPVAGASIPCGAGRAS